MWEKLKSVLPKRSQEFIQSDSGSAAIEFSFVVLPFIFLFWVTLEQGMIMFVEYTMQSAVQQSGRLIRTGQAQTGAYSAAQFKTSICTLASELIDCAGGVTVYVASDSNFGALKAKLPNFLSVGTAVGSDPVAPVSYSCGGPLQTTAVVATFDWKFVMPFMSLNSNLSDTTKRRLVGFAMFQNEPFPAGATCS